MFQDSPQAQIEPYAELELTPSRLQSFVGSLDIRSTEVFRRHDELSKLFHL